MDEDACRSAQEPWGPHPSIHCSHCFHFFARLQKKKAKIEERERSRVKALLTVFAVRLLFVQLHSHTHGSAPLCLSDLRLDSNHGNVEGGEKKPSVIVADCFQLQCGERQWRREETIPTRTAHSRITERTRQPMGEQNLVTDSCHGQSRSASAWQRRLAATATSMESVECSCELRAWS